MMTNRKPEVKSVDGDHNLGDEALKKASLAWEVLQTCIISEKAFTGSGVCFEQRQQEISNSIELHRAAAWIRFI